MPKTSLTASGATRGEPLVLKASAAETSNTTGPWVEAADLYSLSLTVAVSAASGTTPTMTVVIEGTDDGTNAYTLATFGANGYSPGSSTSAPTNFTGAVTVRGCVPSPGLVRYRSVIGGTTPSFTYSVTAG